MSRVAHNNYPRLGKLSGRDLREVLCRSWEAKKEAQLGRQRPEQSSTQQGTNRA